MAGPVEKSAGESGAHILTIFFEPGDAQPERRDRYFIPHFSFPGIGLFPAIQKVQKPSITAELAETAENAAQREMLAPQS
jgi:hypothetical protein